ncbi:MAG: LysM domain-containing protein, partial [Hyphomonas sp.]|nr:LysM domain-containing protein [Hyphomonas sp.]
VYDAIGRQTRQTDYRADGTTSDFDQHTAFNAKGQIELQDSFYRRSDGVYLVRNWQYYGQTSHLDSFSWANYALGSVTHVLTQNFKKDQAVTPLNGNIPLNSIQTASATTTDYAWYDGALQGTITYRESVNSSGESVGGTIARTSVHAYDTAGTLLSASISDGRSRTVTYTSTASGQVVRRSEADGNTSNGDPHEVWYRFGGKELGYTGNNGTLDTNYLASTANRMAIPSGTGAFRNGTTSGSAHVAFDPSLNRINSYSQGSASGGYQVRPGETLASIAANLWGDSSLWYKLAEANGLSGQAALSEGQSLRIPAGVLKNTHNASTFQPYDPADTIGDTAPTTPKPPKKNKCGAFGQILLVVVAVVVSIYTAGAASGAFAAMAQAGATTGGVLSAAGTAGMAALGGGGLAAGTGLAAGMAAGAIGGAAGSIASQAVGVASGIQDKFSWNAVAMAAIGGGVGGGMGLKSYSGWGQAAANAAGQSIVSQGIGMALGLQSKFSWAGVAAAGVSGGVGYKVGKGVEGRFGEGKVAAAARTATVATASSIAHAAMRSAIDGSNFGDNLRASIPDIIGQAIASAITTPSLRRNPAEGQTPEHIERLSGKSAAHAQPSLQPARSSAANEVQAYPLPNQEAVDGSPLTVDDQKDEPSRSNATNPYAKSEGTFWQRLLNPVWEIGTDYGQIKVLGYLSEKEMQGIAQDLGDLFFYKNNGRDFTEHYKSIGLVPDG